MKRSPWLSLSLACILSTACGQGAVAQNADEARAKAAAKPGVDQRDLDPLLRMWAQRSGQLTSLSVKIERTDSSAKWAEPQKFEGKAWFKSPNRACLDFSKFPDGNGPNKGVPVFHERVLCTGSEVWQYKKDTEQVYIYELGKQEQKRALQEGPLPFLFNFRAEEARKRYQMWLRKADPKSFVLEIYPRLKVDQEAFSRVYILLDRKTFFPTRIYLYKPNGKDTQDFILTEVKENASLPDSAFVGNLPKGWKAIRDNAVGDAQPAPGRAPARRIR